MLEPHLFILVLEQSVMIRKCEYRSWAQPVNKVPAGAAGLVLFEFQLSNFGHERGGTAWFCFSVRTRSGQKHYDI